MPDLTNPYHPGMQTNSCGLRKILLSGTGPPPAECEETDAVLQIAEGFL